MPACGPPGGRIDDGDPDVLVGPRPSAEAPAWVLRAAADAGEREAAAVAADRR